ncbi:MAG: sulfite exporter TauE/SafE family protein [Salibacteraceae bacterium]
MEYWEYLLIFAAGYAAGTINTLAGGGGILAMPTLIFLGLPSVVANGTYRLAVIATGMFGVAGFRSKGITTWPYSLYLGGVAFAGALIGAELAKVLDDTWFNRVLAIVMVGIVALMVFRPVKPAAEIVEQMAQKHKILAYIAFFFIGIYGGFIQVGVGLIILATLTSIHGWSIVKSNSAKLMVVMIYTLGALGVFIYDGLIRWDLGLIMAAGNAGGAWVTSRWSVNKGDRRIRILLLIVAIVLAGKLFFF